VPDRSLLQLEPSRRTVQVVSLAQRFFHAGPLEGLPTVASNRRGIEAELAALRRRDPGEPVLIPPRETPLDHPGYPFGTPATLPSVVCVARLRSASPARDPDKAYSELSVVWFQDAFAFPIDADVAAALRRLDWVSLALDEGA
jgi:hypothetical protein